MTYRAGEATLASGHNTIAVTLSSAMPSINYAINVTQEGVVNWGTTTLFGSTTVPNQPVFTVVSQTTAGFTIEVTNGTGATLNAPSGGVTLDWSALNNN